MDAASRPELSMIQIQMIQIQIQMLSMYFVSRPETKEEAEGAGRALQSRRRGGGGANTRLACQAAPRAAVVPSISRLSRHLSPGSDAPSLLLAPDLIGGGRQAGARDQHHPDGGS